MPEVPLTIDHLPDSPEPSPAAARPEEPARPWWQFSLRTMFIMVTLLVIGLAWFIQLRERVQMRHRAVEAIEAAGGFVRYEGDHGQYGSDESEGLTLQFALLLGDENTFRNVVTVTWYALNKNGHFGDEHMWVFDYLTETKFVDLDGAAVTNAGLRHLSSLTRLTELGFRGTPLNEEGLQTIEGLKETLRTISIDQATPKALQDRIDAIEQVHDEKALREYDEKMKADALRRVETGSDG